MATHLKCGANEYGMKSEYGHLDALNRPGFPGGSYL
jgi:hypothetical protein